MRGRRVASALVGLGMATAVAGCAQQPTHRVAENSVWVAESASAPSSPSVTPTASRTTSPTASPTASPAATKRATPAPPPKSPQVAESLVFTAKTVDGKTIRGASLAGKPAVLWFWTPWCPLCHDQVPDVQDAARRFAGKVNVVGVAGMDSAGPIKKFVSEQGIGTFPNVCDESGAVWKHFQVTSQGTYVLIDAAGKIRHRGYLDGESLRNRIAKLSA
jgi:peroxiredoxin